MNLRLVASVLLLVGASCALAQSVSSEKRAPHVFFLIGESEYNTRTTVPAFARKELEPRGVRCTFSILPTDESDDFPNTEAIKDADLLFISVRRHAPPAAQMAAIQAHVDAGKPVVGIRTASHAFALRGKPGQPTKVPEGHVAWPEFDHDVLGGNYNDHYGRGIETFARIVPAQAQHPVLAGIAPDEFKITSHLYKNPNLPAWVTPLMTARMAGRPEVEPLAWVSAKDGRRVFYTSLGAPEDFELPQFRQLLRNGIFWALEGGKAPPKPAGASEEKLRPGRTNAAGLTPAESAQSFAVADDLVLEQVLAEPDIVKPLFLNFDERGRMWVVEYRQYPEPAGLKVLSHDSYWRAVYDKVPPPPPHHDQGRDRITIHESTKGDGVYDKHTTFVDGLNICTAVERQRGGVWVLNPPYLLFYPDADNDDLPDGDPIVHLAGFGIEDTHSVANSLRWGPDGWLYGAHGSTVTARIIRPGLDEKPIAEMQGQAIWRYEPKSRRFEVFCEGGGNTFGVEIDAKGRIFSGHNGGDTRGFHYMEGAYLRKGFDKHGPLSNPYTFGYFDQMAHEKVERFTHNFLIYEGGALPGHTGRLFGAEPLQGRVVESEITPVGSTFQTHDLQRAVTSRDPWFRPVDIKAGPDGAIYFCDWYVPQLGHSRTYSDLQQGPLDLSQGRIYRLRAKDAHPFRPADFGKLETSQLVMGLRDENKWVRQTVQRLLADRPEVNFSPALRKLIETNEGQYALELLWALHNNGGLDEATALKTLAHPDPFVRLWTARLLGDENGVPSSLAAKLVETAEKETNVEVRAQLACTAKRLPARDDLAIVRGLLQHDEDAADPRLPLLLWWAIEARADADRDAVLALFRESPLWDRPIVKQHLLERVMRRYAQAGARKDLQTCAAFFDLAPTPEHSRKLMAGFEAAFKGRPLSGLPEELVAAMRRHGVGSVALNLRAGDPGAVEMALKALADEQAPPQTRLEYVTIFGEVKVPAAVGPLLDLVERTSDEKLCKAALAALAPYDGAKIGPRVVAAFPRLGKEAQSAACTLLASRATTAALLVEAVERSRIGRNAVPLEVVRKIRLFTEKDIPTRAGKIWGSAGRPTSAEMTRKIQHFVALVRDGAGGDPYAGRTVFSLSCGACHLLHGQGGTVGPDLTKFKRDDVDALLLNIVNPNAEIREGYESFLVSTRDGRVVSGFLVEQDPQVVVLRGLDGQNVSLARAEVKEMKAAGVSLMPEGLLDAMDEKQVRDLFAYLRITQPLVGKGL